MKAFNIRKFASGLTVGGLAVLLFGVALGFVFVYVIKAPVTNGGAIQMTEQVKSGAGLEENFNWLMFTLWAAPSAALALLMLGVGSAIRSGAERGVEYNFAFAGRPKLLRPWSLGSRTRHARHTRDAQHAFRVTGPNPPIERNQVKRVIATTIVALCLLAVVAAPASATSKATVIRHTTALSDDLQGIADAADDLDLEAMGLACDDLAVDVEILMPRLSPVLDPEGGVVPVALGVEGVPHGGGALLGRRGVLRLGHHRGIDLPHAGGSCIHQGGVEGDVVSR